MDFSSLIESRRSVRKFQSKPVDDAILQRILDAANSAPSAGNLQAYEIVVVRDEETRKALAAASHGQEMIAQAPVALVFFANPSRSSKKYGERGSSLYCIVDASIAVSYAQLAIANEGLGTVWVGAFDDDEVRKITNAPAALIPVAILPVGYAAEKPDKKPRRTVRDLVKQEHF